MDSLAVEAVDAINAISGVHAGHRAAHAKGILLTGTFTPSAEASALTTAAHMQGEPSRVTVRFSNGGGDPGIPDYAREGRGMAVKFYAPDGEKTDIVSLTLPCFFVRTPEDLIAFTKARREPADAGLPGSPPRGAAGDPGCARRRPARELRHLHLQRAPLVPLGRRRRRLTLGALPVGAGGGRAHASGPATESTLFAGTCASAWRTRRSCRTALSLGTTRSWSPRPRGACALRTNHSSEGRPDPGGDFPKASRLCRPGPVACHIGTFPDQLPSPGDEAKRAGGTISRRRY
jgi:hypothetical protein